MWHVPSAPTVLSGVAALLFLLAVVDSLRHRRLTLAARIRLMAALIFAAVVLWLRRSGAG
ncbi:hypothetical protein CQA4T8M7_08780 [Sphaerotilus natans]|nr:hypothetical protein CQA4T8M7_08780 [Sphaerotilus natans]